LSAPQEDEVEVTIFGPGFGECIVAHVGSGDWIVVDSCIDSTLGRPAALVYLDSLGVDPQRAVKLILATHWHDDHIGGMSELVAACKSTQFACSAALTKGEFLQVMQAFNKRPLIENSSGMSEIQKVLLELKRRSQIPKYVVPDRLLMKLGATEAGTTPRCELTALSPSDREFQRFLQAMCQLIPQAKTTKRRFPSPVPNDLSVAAWLRIESLLILLGADLEEHGGASRGWTAVLNSSTKPTGKASVFKVAHHGSVTGHHNGIWTDLLDVLPVAVLAPWSRGSKLPTKGDCERILGLTTAAYSSSRPVASRIRPRSPAVTRTLREARITIRDSEPPTGYVRLRRLAQHKSSTS
jgi:Metallo-beta-lactamase superfamily